MTLKTFSKSVLLSIFRRKGGPGPNTLPFDGFPTHIQHHLMSQSSLLAGEEPVLASFRDPSEWVLVTTQRLVWSSKAGVMRIALLAIEDVTVDLKANAEMGARTKKDLSQLIVKTAGRETHRLTIEPGPSFFAVWNVLKYFAR
jgi:hypothetical protein